MVTIKVAWKATGRPVTYKGVSIAINGFWTGGVTDRVYTDSNGEANFDIDPCEGTVYVGGREVYNGKIAGRILVYL